MAFEFFFGLFGLISGDSKSRHKSRLDGDWRLFTPLGASLFRDSRGHKAPNTPIMSHNSFMNSADSQHKPIFSTSGTLANANISVSEGVFSSHSSSSASSLASSGSTKALIKPASSALDPISGKKYEFMDQKFNEEKTDKLSGSSSIGSVSVSGSGSGSGKQQLNSSATDSKEAIAAEAAAATTTSGSPGDNKRSFRAIYCRLVCLFLWFNVIRLLIGLVLERSFITLDFYYLGAFRIHFLIPALCLAIQVAAVSLIFIRNNDETNWLVPFYSSKDYLIRSRSNFRPKMEDYTKRVRISIILALALAMMSAVSLPAYLIHSIMQPPSNLLPVAKRVATSIQAATTTSLTTVSSSQTSDRNKSMMWSLNVDHLGISQAERFVLMMLLIYDIFWAVYSTYICFLVSFYFNLICSIMKSRFHGISKIIEDLAESNTSKTTNQARKITTLYLEHNEACELLDESNDFWQYLIFFTYFTYIPAYCYCLYNLFFVDFDTWPSFITWVIHNHTGFIILLISFSAASVSTELPLDVEVNIATFLHRVRGLTIGYSCYDLFAITNASMSNTAAACASYFLIVADFSRSSVFTLSQMNGTGGGGGGNAAVASVAAASGASSSTSNLLLSTPAPA